jgi:type I restriction enzyme R subunit
VAVARSTKSAAAYTEAIALLPETKEQYSSHIPALKTLLACGWDFLSAEGCMAQRSNTRELLLKNDLITFLQTRRYEYKGEQFPLSANAIDQIVRDVASPGLNEGLLTANERFYNRLTLGITVTEFINGKKHSTTISPLDWGDVSRNRFVVTEELEVLDTNGTGHRRPDLVCYVNGMPLVIIEAKRPDSGNPNKSMVDEGISQQIRNQKNDEIPHLYAFSQLLLSISGIDGRYGTTKTPAKFWAKWREEEYSDAYLSSIKSTPLSPGTMDSVFAGKPASIREYYESLWSKPELVTEQDKLLVSLLSPARLLEFVRFFILFDKKVGKLAARYPQVFGVKALLERISQRNNHGGREGGVIWHTTGSGKSFAMVYLCKALLMHPSIKDCRIIVVTDRITLGKQLARTFLSGGAFGSEIASKIDGEKSKVRSGKELAKRIGQGSERIIFSIINKFNTASKLPECYNPSDKLIVLIDEGHRSQGDENHERMRKALPNAAYVAFTGTPLLKGEKTTNKFGPIVHAYTMQRAVEDGTVTPLLYEERQPALSINAMAIDNWFDKITANVSEEQKADLKQKFARKGAVYGSDARIELIAWDIAIHFNKNFKELRLGLKGQVATESKMAAIRYKKHLDATGLVSSAVVISPPDTREGHRDVDETALPEVQQWWKETIGQNSQYRQTAEEYEREIIEHFGTEGEPDLLIVVDKLLTGFDEPRNAVLYIDKPLKEHTLMQAVARVNRLHEQKQYGLLIDYRGILEELDTSITQYQDLASRTQAGYDIDDIDGLYRQMSTEYKRLPLLHDALWEIFKSVTNRQDQEQYRQVLIPEYTDYADGVSYDKRQKVREGFYAALTEFGLCLKLALSSRAFLEDGSFTEEMIQGYKNDLRFFVNLRKIARQDAQETVDYSAYEQQIRLLVDKQVVGNEIRESEGVYIVGELGKEKTPEGWSEEKIRNETDLIKTRVRKTIEQELAVDPYAQKVFSELLRLAIKEAEALFDHPIKQYALFQAFEDKLQDRGINGIPAQLVDNPHARAYYGIFRLVVGDNHFEAADVEEIDALIRLALETDDIVDRAVAEHSLSPQSIEASISKSLLPRLFKTMGMENTKAVIEKLIHITRVGLSGRIGR